MTGLHTAGAPAAAGAAAAVIGFGAGGTLVERGLAHLEVATPRHASAAGRVACALGGVGGICAARHAGSWWLLPAMLVWAYGLTAAASCDALTQRVPTPLVRQTFVLTAVLVVTAAVVSEHWRWVALAAFSAAAALAVFAVCWRFLGAGFGDVRLAALGGVGLVNPTHLGVAAGVAAFTVITVSQAVVTLARGGNRHTLFPYGPGIAVAFLVAASM